jgi:hypothetical protein
MPRARQRVLQLGGAGGGGGQCVAGERARYGCARRRGVLGEGVPLGGGWGVGAVLAAGIGAGRRRGGVQGAAPPGGGTWACGGGKLRGVRALGQQLGGGRSGGGVRRPQSVVSFAPPGGWGASPARAGPLDMGQRAGGNGPAWCAGDSSAAGRCRARAGAGMLRRPRRRREASGVRAVAAGASSLPTRSTPSSNRICGLCRRSNAGQALVKRTRRAGSEVHALLRERTGVVQPTLRLVAQHLVGAQDLLELLLGLGRGGVWGEGQGACVEN